MKKLLLILLCGIFIFNACKKEEEIQSPSTFIPDDNFERYLINSGFDDVLDDYVVTVNIDTITHLDISNPALGCAIVDLTGIEDFTALTDLVCNFNHLTSLDLSNNTALTFLNCRDNLLTSLNLNNNTALTFLNCGGNHLTSLDISQNTSLTSFMCFMNNLTTLDVSQNIVLTTLWCDANLLSFLDVSNNSVLTDFNCNQNNLISLDLRNGNNMNMSFINCSYNFSLYCINVDNSVWSVANWGIGNFVFDVHHYFSENCP